MVRKLKQENWKRLSKINELFHRLFNFTWTKADGLIDIVEVAIGPPQIRKLICEDICECGAEHSPGYSVTPPINWSMSYDSYTYFIALTTLYKHAIA
jgi:hypothetical protein